MGAGTALGVAAVQVVELWTPQLSLMQQPTDVLS